MLFAIFTLSAITLTIAIFQLLTFVKSKREYILRIKKYIDIQEIERRRAPKKDLKAGLGAIGNAVSRVSFLGNYKTKIQKELIRAHILLKGEEFITLSIISTGISILLFGALFRNLATGMPFGILGWMAPLFVVQIKKKKRVRLINGQLSDAIVLIANSLKAGYSFFQATEMVSKEMSPPISEEFAQLQKEINLGYTTEQALENLSNRVESDDLGLVIIAVLTQRQVGGNLAEILDNISSTIRDRIKIKGEIRTLTAQGRISGAIISMVPIGLGVVLQLMDPNYMSTLFSSKIGWCILGVAAVMQIVGIYSINRIIKIEV